MSKRGSWGSMADRVRQSGPPEPSASDISDPPPAPPSLKHCWVTDGHGRLPGLLLQWRRTEADYQGRVVRVIYEDGGWSVVEEWLPASMLEPA